METNVRRGWFSHVPPNGFQNRPDRLESNNNVLGLDTPEPDIEIETSPEHRNLTAGDPECADWERRTDHPGVVALRDELREHNGIPDLEVISPHEIERAVELFHRDGFVVVQDALTGEQFHALRTASETVVDDILAGDPDASIGGGAGGLPHRYSFGMTSASRHRLHHREWVDVIDLPTTRSSDPRITSWVAAVETSLFPARSSTKGSTRTTCGLNRSTRWEESRPAICRCRS